MDMSQPGESVFIIERVDQHGWSRQRRYRVISMCHTLGLNPASTGPIDYIPAHIEQREEQEGYDQTTDCFT